MKINLDTKVQAMLWDIPKARRSGLAKQILTDPVNVFRNDEQLFIKALNSLRWHELTSLVSMQDLFTLLNDSTIRKLFPPQRRTHYMNARRLLSKYCLSSTG